MGEIDKTTLVRKVYENESVKRHFDYHVWITVSLSYNVQKILMSMANQIYHEEIIVLGQIDMTDEITLISQLKKCLQQKRIIITTRSDLICVSCKESLIDMLHKLQPLPQEKAWDLFCRKAFQTEFQRLCPSELMRLSMEIVKKFEGLPLAIVAIGGLLSTKEKVPLECKKLLDSLSYELECNPYLTSVTKIIALSYHDLPCYLKFCYLYFGIFPDDNSNSGARLVWLWVAEGFITRKKGKPLEDVAEEFLMELIHRNFVQVSFGELDYEIYKRYIIHDLLHEIILSKVHELNLCQVLDADDTTSHGKSRCLSIHDATEDVFESSEYSRVRSIFLFNITELPKSFIVKLFKKFKLLKVLDFEDAPIDYLPQEVGNLFHLKHLSLSKTEVKILPKSVGRLHNLQTLNVLETLVCELPVEIFRLYKLRQIFAHSHDFEIQSSLYSERGVKVHEGVGCLNELQELSMFKPDGGEDYWKVKKVTTIRPRYRIKGERYQIYKLSNLDFLECLQGYRIKEEQYQNYKFGDSDLLERLQDDTTSHEKVDAYQSMMLQKMFLSQFKLLKVLDFEDAPIDYLPQEVGSISDDEIVNLESISSPPPFLKHIYLIGQLKKLSNWIPELQNLVTLILFSSSLEKYPLSCVQTLPNLITLSLNHAYDGEQLHFEKGSFQRLKRLTLRDMKKLKMVEMDRGSLPSLEQLEIGPCPLLKEVPSGIQHLESLKLIDFYEMQREFVLRMQPDGGEDYWKVHNVTTICLRYRIKGERYQIYYLVDMDLLERLQG
ncbi:disease resistance protein RPM1-like [Corylus avellana]|uniref:disease resistance protein RPM1-like n=1 Tax=Corylus avellana TaxID=13451 RepID=UPI00286B0F76|nr:disease resistance protein RPM1-like [Corylus avellana]